jgi:hypothetical protein
VGTGVLPFSIIPPDATSTAGARAIAGDHANSEIYDLSGDPSSGALSTSDTQRIRNKKGYVVGSWSEARMQIRCNLGILGALCGNNHGVTSSWSNMLRRYERVETRLQHAMDLEFNPRLVLIPQVRPAHKYPNSPWEMIHPPGGDNAVCM